MNFKLIILIIALNAILLWIYKVIVDQLYAKKFQHIKNYLSSLLGLNISHLHDAANFFALIKEQSHDSRLQNFAKGASFHFRSIFEELNLNKKNFDKLDINAQEENQLSMLYAKEVIDLKDILELELLQLSASYNDRLEVLDKSNAEHALSLGNFSLLSKAILNLIENALKYTEKPIKLELNDAGNSWQIKVSSYGKSIPESLANAINNQESEVASGHGLNSLTQIMLFHNAELIIDTLADEGSSIKLIFKKYHHEANQVLSKVSTGKTFAIKREVIVLTALALIIIALGSIIYHNRVACQAYYMGFNKKINSANIIQKERACLKYLTSLNEILVDDIPEKLYLEYPADDKEELFEQVYYDFISQFREEDKELVSLIIFDQILITAPIEYQELIDKEAKSLIIEFPAAPNLNLYLSNHYYEDKKYGRATIYSLRSLISIFESKLYMHPRLYLVSKLSKDPEKLSQFLAAFYNAPILVKEEPFVIEPELSEGDSSNSAAAKTKEVANNTKANTTNTTIKTPVSPSKANAYDELIDKQDKELGLKMEL